MKRLEGTTILLRENDCTNVNCLDCIFEMRNMVCYFRSKPPYDFSRKSILEYYAKRYHMSLQQVKEELFEYLI